MDCGSLKTNGQVNAQLRHPWDIGLSKEQQISNRASQVLPSLGWVTDW